MRMQGGRTIIRVWKTFTEFVFTKLFIQTFLINLDSEIGSFHLPTESLSLKQNIMDICKPDFDAILYRSNDLLVELLISNTQYIVHVQAHAAADGSHMRRPANNGICQ